MGLGQVWFNAVILVVDDHQEIVELALRILQRGGYRQLYGETDSRRVEEHVAQLKPNLVLLDLHMPHLDGFAVIDRIGPALAAGTQVLLVTGENDEDVRKEALAHGAGGVVTKPFDFDELLATVASHLGVKRSEL